MIKRDRHHPPPLPSRTPCPEREREREASRVLLLFGHETSIIFISLFTPGNNFKMCSKRWNVSPIPFPQPGGEMNQRERADFYICFSAVEGDSPPPPPSSPLLFLHRGNNTCTEKEKNLSHKREMKSESFSNFPILFPWPCRKIFFLKCLGTHTLDKSLSLTRFGSFWFIFSWCFTSTETVWLIRNGETGGWWGNRVPLSRSSLRSDQ